MKRQLETTKTSHLLEYELRGFSNWSNFNILPGKSVLESVKILPGVGQYKMKLSGPERCMAGSDRHVYSIS
ncbi:hypothetical protein L596_017854 [Steinernema carpocapsae]|uniref:Uncharacterized protein n=1 Tax=Steinernema carpocapsae TaxID=34508 RepID=A0A4U5N396_STECR|nr:hypothetical protein L596_017854 [Steinernema carpocapsae]